MDISVLLSTMLKLNFRTNETCKNKSTEGVSTWRTIDNKCKNCLENLHKI